ncbi:cupin domain-containing protein [Roseomonas sp. CCTCC AB2023176]|uniref:cupin domain-containing protein n=1 Tax=Roseomonas sp. CCTCC AB2023176 TaxID=3342640 RepID=UPI0035E2D62B
MNQEMTQGRVLRAEKVTFSPFSLPGFTGGTAAAFLNTDTTQAPFVALLRLEPGAVLARHYHPKAIEAVYVLDGEMINDGERLARGSMLSHGPGVLHGPHATETGCTLMFIQYPGVGPDDSVFV